MTEYYTNKSDFEQGKRIGWFEDNVSQVKDLLKDISETAEIVPPLHCQRRCDPRQGHAREDLC